MTTRAKVGRVVSDEDLRPGGFDPELDSDYNPADFIISGSDHQGHNERIFARVQPQHSRTIGLITKSGKFPFRTEGDLIRWCVVRGLRVLDRLDPTPGFIGAADAITEILRQEMYLQEFVSMFAQMEKVIAAHVAAGADREARKLLGTVMQKIRAIDEPHWRRRCEEDINRRFGHLMEGGRGALGRGRAKLTQDADMRGAD